MKFSLICGHTLENESHLLMHSSLIADLTALISEASDSDAVRLDVSLEDLECLDGYFGTGRDAAPPKRAPLGFPRRVIQAADYLLIPRTLMEKTYEAMDIGRRREELVRHMECWSPERAMKTPTPLTHEELAAPIHTDHSAVMWRSMPNVVQTFLGLLQLPPHCKITGIAVCRVKDSDALHWQLHARENEVHKTFTYILDPVVLERQRITFQDPVSRGTYRFLHEYCWIVQHSWLHFA